MTKEEIQKIALEVYQREHSKSQSINTYSVSKIPYHVHNNIDSPQIGYQTLIEAPPGGIFVTNTNGTTNVNVFSTGVPFNFTITGVFLISLDTTAGNITVINGSTTVATIAKGTTATALVGATSLSGTAVKKGNVFQVDSSSAGNATVFITYTL